MSSSSSSSTQSHSHSSFSQLLRSIFSDNSNIMLAAIISLLLVILFVLLLHLYAKWFLVQAQVQAQARRRRRRRRPVTVSDVLGPSRFHHFHTFNLQPDSPVSPSKGLDSAAIAAIPVFVYEEGEYDDNEEEDRELECVICLSAFGDGEIGRSLPKCAHAFHLECIDMWLASHSNCPICRAPINVSEMGSCVNFGDDSSALLEIVIDSSPTSEINISESETHSTSTGGVTDSAVSISETSSSLLVCSLKRTLSKVFPSNVNELNQ